MKWIKRRPECKTIKDVVLANVGMSEEDFLSPTKNYFINGLAEAATTIKKAISKGEKITLVSDYDADGICSGTILKLAFDALGLIRDYLLLLITALRLLTPFKRLRIKV